MVFLLDVLTREWFPTLDCVILTESLLFETARAAARANALDQGLDQVVDLGLVRHVQLLETGLNLRFSILCI